jgi:hypothetical protein
MDNLEASEGFISILRAWYLKNIAVVGGLQNERVAIAVARARTHARTHRKRWPA